MSFFIIAFAVGRPTANDSVYNCSFRLHELLDYLFNIHKYYLLNRFFYVYRLNFCLGSRLFIALKVWKKMLGFNDNLLVIFQKLDLHIRFI